MATEMDDKIAYTKLQTVSDIKQGTAQLEQLQQRLLAQLVAADAERHALAEYRRELQLLLQEKMAHVEELRQIHADINTIEEVIKQSGVCQQRSSTAARQLLAEYRPLKQQVDSWRHQLQLQPLADITQLSSAELPVAELLEPLMEASAGGGADARHDAAADDAGAAAAAAARVSSFLSLSGVPLQPAPALTSSSAAAAGFLASPQFSRQMADLMRAKLAAAPAQHHHHQQQQQQQQSTDGVSTALSQQQHAPTPHQATMPPRHSPTPFRQQPPPMKSCLSCHQQIHRNAPICPLCKAKSRSRNPKKPKKKD